MRRGKVWVNVQRLAVWVKNSKGEDDEKQTMMLADDLRKAGIDVRTEDTYTTPRIELESFENWNKSFNVMRKAGWIIKD